MTLAPAYAADFATVFGERRGVPAADRSVLPLTWQTDQSLLLAAALRNDALTDSEKLDVYEQTLAHVSSLDATDRQPPTWQLLQALAAHLHKLVRVRNETTYVHDVERFCGIPLLTSALLTAIQKRSISIIYSRLTRMHEENLLLTTDTLERHAADYYRAAAARELALAIVSSDEGAAAVRNALGPGEYRQLQRQCGRIAPLRPDPAKMMTVASWNTALLKRNGQQGTDNLWVYVSAELQLLINQRRS